MPTSKTSSPPRASQLRASVFLTALSTLRDESYSYSCHQINYARGAKAGDGTPERDFYEALFQNDRGRLPACFGDLNYDNLFTVRVVALSLAALLVEDGFYLDEAGEIVQTPQPRRGSILRKKK